MESFITLTNNEKILLYLLPYSRQDFGMEVPIRFTQKGISEALCISQSHVSYAVNALKEKNLITEELAYIKGGKRRRKTYFLSDIGYKNAMELEERVGQEKAKVRTNEGDIEVQLCDVKTYLEERLPLWQLVDCIDDKGIVDVSRLKKHDKENIEEAQEYKTSKPAEGMASEPSADEDVDKDVRNLAEETLEESVETALKFLREEMGLAKRLRKESIKVGRRRIKKTMNTVKKMRKKLT